MRHVYNELRWRNWLALELEAVLEVNKRDATVILVVGRQALITHTLLLVSLFSAAMLPTKRKLEFSTHKQAEERRRLSAKGRCFYLDLVGRDDLTARFQQELTKRGAVSCMGFSSCKHTLVMSNCIKYFICHNQCCTYTLVELY